MAFLILKHRLSAYPEQLRNALMVRDHMVQSFIACTLLVVLAVICGGVPTEPWYIALIIIASMWYVAWLCLFLTWSILDFTISFWQRLHG